MANPITIWCKKSGTLARLARLRKGLVFSALYTIVVLVAQLIIGVVAALTTAQFLVAVLAPWAGLFGVVVLPVILIGFRKLDNRIYAFYLMQDYTFFCAVAQCLPHSVRDPHKRVSSPDCPRAQK